MVMARGEEWVVVRRGRRAPPRRVQFFHKPQDGARVDARRKDRAKSISHQGGRWTQSIFPNPSGDSGNLFKTITLTLTIFFVYGAHSTKLFAW